MARRNEIRQEDKHRISKILWFLYCIFLILSLVLIIRIVDIQFFWEPDPDTVSYFQPARYENKTKPERGTIMDMNGKLLAISTPLYNINMDCAVLKDEFRTGKTPKMTDSLEREWKRKARLMCNELPKVLKDGKTADEYYNLIIRNRESETLRGRRNVPIAKNIDHSTYLKLCELPLFNEGQFKSGMIKTEVDTRQYPYGTLAGRVIGDVRINQENPEESRYLGLEGQYDYILRGKEGTEWMKRTDKGSITDPDSTIVEVEHGKDIRTTLDIDIQDIADRALRRNIGDDQEIEGGCVVVLDVKTGAVRAMVNLQRNSKGELGEYFNMAIGRPGEPGSIFKAVTLATLLEDGKVKLSQTIPTNHGKIAEMPEITADSYITDWERNHKTSSISIQDGFKISSNYVFRRLVLDHYGDKPQKFIDKLYGYKLNNAYTFDLEEKGGTKSRIPDPGTSEWSRSTLPSTAIGYSVMETPLNIVTFYNTIANNGKMMKPYLIESQEVDGRVVKKFGPEILNASAFSKATADSLTKALTMVTLEGTGATRLKNAKCVVAGKTGTARVALNTAERGKSSDAYKSEDGKRKYQATFGGFFPADAPKYTAIVTVYSKLSDVSVYGSSTPALAFKEIVDDLWALDPSWGNIYKERAKVPEMRTQFIGTQKGEKIPVPNVIGMGLMDAIYAIENNGYKCSHEGMGHVVSQSLKAGETYKKGETIKIVLK